MLFRSDPAAKNSSGLCKLALVGLVYLMISYMNRSFDLA